MGIREKIAANAHSVLQPGEAVQAVMAAQGVNPYWSIVSYWIIIFSNAYRVVIVTDRRILVCRAGRLSVSKVGTPVAELPRSTRIGPATGKVWCKTESLGEPLWIHRRFFKDIAAADQAA